MRPRPRHLLRRALLGATCALGLLAAPAAGTLSGDVANDAGLQWNLNRIGAAQAWEVSTGAGTTIAVIDSGVALEHEDLVDKLDPGVACQGTDGDPSRCTGSPQDDDGHGTHVAGVAGASTGNGLGIAGTAPDARIIPIKVLFTACDSCQSNGETADVSAAVRWAADRGATVINLSLGSTTSAVFGPSFVDAVRYAWSKGSIPVVAAGNDDVRTADLGDAPAVVVSSTDRDDRAPGYSGGVGEARWAVSAPGGDGSDTPESCSQQGEPRGILSTYWSPADPTGAYACLSGTSMAAPLVSGALAVLRGAGLSPDEAVRRLLDTAVDLGEPGPDVRFGAGRIDLAAAVGGIGVAVPAATPSSEPLGPTDPGPVTEEAARPDSSPDRTSTPLGPVLLAGVLIAGTGTAAAVGLTRTRTRRPPPR